MRGGPGPEPPPAVSRRRRPGAARRRHAAGRTRFEVVEPDPAVDEPLDRQPPREMERGVAREVDRGIGEPVVGAEDPPAAVDQAGRRRTRPVRRDGVMPTRTAVPAERQRSIASSTVATRPIASNTKSGPPSVRSRSASIVLSGSSPARSASVAPTVRATSSLAADPVDRHDLPGPGQRGAHHARQPDATEPDDRDARAGRDLGRLQHRPDAGRHAAADERGDGRVHAVGEHDRGRLGHDGRPRPSCRCRSRPSPARRPRPSPGPCAVGHPMAERRRIRAGPRPAGAAGAARRRTAPARTAPRAGRPATVRTPSPTASTTPAPSWPMATGVGRGHSPSRTCRSE